MGFVNSSKVSVELTGTLESSNLANGLKKVTKKKKIQEITGLLQLFSWIIHSSNNVKCSEKFSSIKLENTINRVADCVH